MASIETAPYSQWLESVVRDLYDIEPVCIAMEMRDTEGQVYTSYWGMDANDLSCFIDTLKNESIMIFVRDNKQLILDILHEEGGEGDGLCETDTDPAESG